jgi:hypothetical protein
VKEGYRNLSYNDEGDTLTIGFWPLGFRDEYRAYETLKKRIQTLPDENASTIVLNQYSWGIRCIRSVETIDSAPERIEYSYATQQSSIHPAPKVIVQFDIPVTARFGNYFDSMVFKTGIRSDVQFMIFPGCVVYGQLDLYVHNEFDPEMWYKPADIGVVYIKPLNQKTLSVTNVGAFDDGVYGIDEVVKTHFLNDALTVGFHGGIFGGLAFGDNRFYYDSMNMHLLLAEVEWSVIKYDCSLALTGGQYVHGDKGVGLGITRVFKEVEIGAEGVLSGKDLIAYVDFSIPLYPKSRLSTAKYGIGMRRNFDFTYRYDSDGMPQKPKKQRGFVPHTGITYREFVGLARPNHFYYMMENYKWSD